MSVDLVGFVILVGVGAGVRAEKRVYKKIILLLASKHIQLSTNLPPLSASTYYQIFILFLSACARRIFHIYQNFILFLSLTQISYFFVQF